MNTIKPLITHTHKTIFLGLGLAFLSVPCLAGVLVVDDFTDGNTTTLLGGAIDQVNNVTRTVAANSSSEPSWGNTGNSLKVAYTTGADSYLLIRFSSNRDLRNYASLSFWVRGAAGGERFNVSLHSAGSGESGTRPDIRNFLPSGVTTSWQKVVIPLPALETGFLVNSSTALSDVDYITLTVYSAVPTETFYIDQILFHTKAAPVWVENFNDGAEPGPFGLNMGNWVNGGTGASVAHVYDVANYASAPAGSKITWTAGSASPTDAVAQFLLDPSPDAGTGVGVDVTGCDTISFKIKGAGSGIGTQLALGMKDDAGLERIFSSPVTLTSSFETYNVPLSHFAIDKSKAVQVQCWFINSDSTRGIKVSNTTSQDVFIDDIILKDTVSPSAPALFKDDGYLIEDGHVFGPTNVMTWTGATASSDPTIEGFRLEHDNMTGGVTWYMLAYATNTASADYSLTLNAGSFAAGAGTSYRVRLVAMDVAGNESVISAAHCEVDPVTNDTQAPSLTHTAVSMAPAGQALSVSVSASDDKRVGKVTLYYRTKGTSDYNRLNFDVGTPHTASFSGSVSIPASSMTASGVEYYIEATDFVQSAFFASAASPQTVLVVQTSQSSEITSAGGTITVSDSSSSDGETSLTVPAGALRETVSITVAQADVTTLPSGAALGREQPFAAFTFSPDGLRFDVPVTLTMRYLDRDQDGFVEDSLTGANTTLAEASLKMFTWDGSQWVPVGGIVDSARNTVTASITHFSTYAVFPQAALTKDQIRPREKIITPAGSPGVNDEARFGGSASGAKIEFFDIHGRLIRRLENQTSWDGRDFDGVIVESGVYLYNAEIDGQKVNGSITVAR
ncbi:MAG TPA: carbohydrate binding domain-containing protein [Elusimicrobiota bacterium]|nr:carbohydrate binding domain-containing protein [Elusimicrobiota bacterium]